MGHIETDYLVVGAGASGMAFVDALLAEAPDVDVVLVDRRHRPGGHWLDAYPFVRLHQPSANYGVSSRRLGADRIDEAGLNAGFYERASAGEICDYFGRVLDEQMLPTGRVRFLGMTDHRGSDGASHRVVSLLSGDETTVTVRRRFVDATYTESSIPSRHTPTFGVDDGVRLVTPNDLVDLDTPPAGWTVLGAGKTAMDTCNWLLDQGVDPDRIEWFRPRDSWLFDRRHMQPLELVGQYMQMQASWVEAAAAATSADDLAARLEEAGVFVRIDRAVTPEIFRGATISEPELAALATIERTVRGRRVRHIGTTAVTTDHGDLPTNPGQVFVDCTARGLGGGTPRPVFEAGRITLQYVTIGIVPWSAAVIGAVEALGGDDDTRNQMCPPLTFGDVADLPRLAHGGMSGLVARAGHPTIGAWNEACRLNPGRGAIEQITDPLVGGAFARMGEHFGAAMKNLARLVAAPVATA